MRHHPSERGQSMAWTAILFATVLVPLSLFIVMGARAWRTRNLIQEATDAGCQAAADAAANIEAYRNGGEIRFYNRDNSAWSIGLSVFNSIIAPEYDLGFGNPSFQIVSGPNQTHVHCVGRARVMVWGGRKTIVTESFSAIRYSR